MVYAYNISVDDVLAQYPTQDGTTITATSRGVNHATIEVFRDQAAAIMSNVLKRHGIAPELLDADGEAMVRDAVIAYVIAKCLLKLGRLDQSKLYMDQFEGARRILREMPQDLGDNQQAAQQVHTSIPDEPREPDRWSSQEGSGWSGF
jgi:hypothetical protein